MAWGWVAARSESKRLREVRSVRLMGSNDHRRVDNMGEGTEGGVRDSSSIISKRFHFDDLAPPKSL